MFQDLAKCGSVSELIIKLTVYGKNWNRWSWAMFIYFLWERIYDQAEAKSAGFSYPSSPGENECYAMLDDILDTIDGGNGLDAVFTNKIIVKTMLQIAEQLGLDGRHGSCCTGTYAGLLCVLAHVFEKFPSMWKMNWMFVRHVKPKNGRTRTHRLMSALPAAAKRPAGYFESDAFRQDFVHRYWKYSVYR